MEEQSSEGNALVRYRKSKKHICRNCNRRLKRDLKKYHKECNRFCCEVDEVMDEIEQLRYEVVDLRSEGKQTKEKRTEVDARYSKIKAENSRLQKWCDHLGEENKRLQSILQALVER
eukprot:g1751.t1